jgi:hypothetical protein
VLNSKKMRGSKTGAHIAIALIEAPRRLVIGEGIETVLAVWTAHQLAGRPIDDTAFWAAGDLGNIAGRATETVRASDAEAAERPRRSACPGPSGSRRQRAVDSGQRRGADAARRRRQRAGADAIRDGARGAALRAAGPHDPDRVRAGGAGFQRRAAGCGMSGATSSSWSTPRRRSPRSPRIPAAIAEAVRKFGLAELDARSALVRAAEGDAAQAGAGDGRGEQLGQLVAAGALVEGFARAALEDAAAHAG